VLDRIRALLFPPTCIACDAAGPALCAACGPTPGDAVRFTLDGIPGFALGAYEGALRRAVISMKRGERDPLDAFAALLHASAPALSGTLVAVPTTRRRIAARGFDQGFALAQRLAALRGLQAQRMLQKRGAPQEGRGRAERLAATGRFSLLRGAVRPARVVLIDDVCTTGATLADAVETLWLADVEVTRILVVARADATSSVPPA
jgi:predicted amidophosphoribosyltransferase